MQSVWERNTFILFTEGQKKEMPARLEEIHHAKEEGIEFLMLTNPTEIVGDEEGKIVQMKCERMELGEPDESGRRSPVPVEGSEFLLVLIW